MAFLVYSHKVASCYITAASQNRWAIKMCAMDLIVTVLQEKRCDLSCNPYCRLLLNHPPKLLRTDLLNYKTFYFPVLLGSELDSDDVLYILGGPTCHFYFYLYFSPGHESMARFEITFHFEIFFCVSCPLSHSETQ